MESTHRACSFDGCDRPYSASGYCRTHYEQHRRGRTLTAIRRYLQGSLDERLAAMTQKTPSCWNWIGVIGDDGYGRLTVGSGYPLAHRLAYIAAKGDIPDGMHVDHMCHNRACVNPAHLQAVTPKQNAENRAGAQPRNRTGVRGVSWSKPVHKWQAQVGHNMGRVHLGYFDSVEEAGRAALSKRNELFTNNLRDRPPILQRLGITDPLEDTQPARPKETP